MKNTHRGALILVKLQASAGSIQVPYELIKIVLTEYPAFKSLVKMIQEQPAAAVIIALISEKNKLREKQQKGRVYMWCVARFGTICTI